MSGKMISGKSLSTRQHNEETERFTHQVAELAWLHGLAPNSIASKLGGPELIMKVKHALARAVREGILVLKPPLAADCAERLRTQPQLKGIEFTVVRSDYFHDLEAICAAASDTISDKITALLKAKPAPSEVIIGNAGGRAVSEAVRLLQKNPPVLAPYDGKRLTFLALNSAGRRRNFNHSSNFLAVRLAEIFGSNHIAILDHTDPDAEKEYVRKAQRIDLLICGAGGLDSLLIEHATEHKVPIPENLVGDMAFIPLDSEGRQIENPNLNKVLAKLSPHPNYAEILRIARDQSRTVLVIFSEHEPKLKIARAVLTAGLATHCVLGFSLANRLINLLIQDTGAYEQ